LRILVTGAAGFIGRHTCRAFLEAGHAVTALDLEGAGPVPDTDWFECGPSSGLPEQLMRNARPFDSVVHLAGRTKGTPGELRTANRGSVRALLKRIGMNAGRFVLAGSSAVYGRVPDDSQPVGEDYGPLLPVTPYGESMLEREEEAAQICDRLGLPLCILRLFNVIGPGQQSGMLVPDTMRRLAEAEGKGGRPTITTGPLDACRDFVDVRDAAAAFVRACEKRSSGTFNICSGACVSTRRIVEELVAILDPGAEIVEESGGPGSPVARLEGDNHKALDSLGWAPSIPLEASLRDAVSSSRGVSGTGS